MHLRWFGFHEGAKKQWMAYMLSCKDLIYVKKLNKDELYEIVCETDGKKFIEDSITGKEFIVQWHLFERENVPVIAQWRCTDCGFFT